MVDMDCKWHPNGGSSFLMHRSCRSANVGAEPPFYRVSFHPVLFLFKGKGRKVGPYGSLICRKCLPICQRWFIWLKMRHHRSNVLRCKEGEHVKRQNWGLIASCATLVVVALIVWVLFSQAVVAHKNGFFTPQYTKEELGPVLSEKTLKSEDYDLLMRQTGLGKSAVNLLKAQGEEGVQQILHYQDLFFAQRYIQCEPMLGWFTREDVMTTESGEPMRAPPIIAAEPGDIIVSLSTHSFGWKHGHAGLVVDAETTLESRVLGQNSETSSIDSWRQFANYAVLRVKDASPEERQKVADYGMEVLHDVPYRLTAGVFHEKAASQESQFFGLQCAYLVWYAWQHFGVDLDSDEGRIVTPLDLCVSDRLEVVQMYGFDPEVFLRQSVPESNSPRP